eukprot:COSAG05_NODE_17498_length_324_cov_0.888889_1_plen_75_part_10
MPAYAQVCRNFPYILTLRALHASLSYRFPTMQCVSLPFPAILTLHTSTELSQAITSQYANLFFDSQMLRGDLYSA